jgi:uncharacterized protein (TIGR00369 family)
MKKLPKELKKLFPHPDNWGMQVGYEFVEYRTGWIRTKLNIKKKHISPSGVTHGGVLSSFVDWSMGGAVFTLLRQGQLCSTIEFKLNYLSPVHLGETIFCDAKVKYAGKSHAVIEFHVWREKGKDVAVGVGTYNIYSKIEKRAAKTP